MTERRAYYLSLGALAILAVMSVIWYRERVLYVDPTYVSFEIIHSKALAISERRYGAFVTQGFPLIGVWLGLSLKTILVAYSASFYVFYLVVVGFLGWWRQYALGILMVMYLTLIVSDVYFWPNNEIHQAVGWMLLFLGLYRHWRNAPIAWWGHFILVALLSFATVSHLLAAAPLMFLWVYLGLTSVGKISDRPGKRWLAYSFLIVLAVGIRYWLSTSGWYDSIKLEAVHEVSLSGIIDTFTSGHAATMAGLTLSNYWLIYPLLALGIYGVAAAGKWYLIPLTLAGLIAYFILVCTTYPVAFGRQYLAYFESEWMAWGMILATPFVIHYLPRLRWWVAVSGLTILLGVRFFYISEASIYYKTRFHNLEILSEELENVTGGKAVLPSSNVWAADYFGFTWGLPTETALYSVVKGRPVTTTLKLAPATVLDGLGGDVFLGDFNNANIRWLDPRYQRLSNDYYTELGEGQIERLRSRLILLPD